METNEKLMLTAEDVAEILQVKPSRAYTIIRQMNTELAAMGKLVIRGRVNRHYFEQKISIKKAPPRVAAQVRSSSKNTNLIISKFCEKVHFTGGIP